MQDKLTQFISNLSGQFVEVSDRNNVYQCMDLIYLWVFSLGFPKATIQKLYAYQVYTEATDLTRQYFDIIPNTPDAIPEAGDLVVWNKTASNIAGHIAIALGGGNTSKFKAFEQNSPIGTNANVKEKGYTNCLGFLRPKVAIISDIPQWLSTLLAERGLTIKNESEIRTIFDKASRYDREVKELREQLITANETLSAKSQELAVSLEELQKSRDKASSFEELYNTTFIDKNEAELEAKSLELKVEDLEAKLEVKNDEIEKLKERIAGLKEDGLKGLSRWRLLLLIVFKK